MNEATSTRSDTPLGIATFSIRRLMLCVLAIAIGMALGRLPQFDFTHGFFATASVLIVAHLVAELQVIRQQSQIANHERRLHFAWRILLLLSMVGFFLLVAIYNSQGQTTIDFGGGKFATRFLGRSMFADWTYAPEVMLQVALFSVLMIGAPLPKPTRWKIPIVVCILVWVFLLIYRFGELVLLVQIAIEAMEVSAPFVQYGELSQYAVDSGTMFAGVEPNTQRRGVRFALVSLAGAATYGAFLLSVFWVASRFQQDKRSRWQVKLMWLLLCVAGVYPIWVYSAGLRQLCPAFASAGIDGGLIPIVCGAIATVLVSLLIAYRFVATPSNAASDDRFESATESRDAYAAIRLPQIHITALLALLLAHIAWLGLLTDVSSIFSWSWLEKVQLAVVTAACYVSLATIIVMGGQLYTRFFSTKQSPRSIGHTKAAAMWTVFGGFVGSISIAAPTIWWLTYSVRLWITRST